MVADGQMSEEQLSHQSESSMDFEGLHMAAGRFSSIHGGC